MSFILDALKKSDAKRRAQLGPDLATPTAPTAPSTRRHSKPILMWGLIGLVGVLSIGGGVVWLVSDRDALPISGPGTQQAVASQTEAVGERSDADPELDPDPSQSMRPAEPVEIIEGSVAVAPSEAAAPSTATPATVEQKQSVAGTTPTSQSAPVMPEPDPASVEALEARLAAASERESLAAVGDVEETAEVTEEGAETEPLAEADLPEEVWQPQAADYLYQWELPLTVRQSLPALNLLVHVYSNLPEDRFVLINGTRFREGDELSPGVRLAEIRPEGALIDFRDYRFLLSQ